MRGLGTCSKSGYSIRYLIWNAMISKVKESMLIKSEQFLSWFISKISQNIERTFSRWNTLSLSYFINFYSRTYLLNTFESLNIAILIISFYESFSFINYSRASDQVSWLKYEKNLFVQIGTFSFICFKFNCKFYDKDSATYVTSSLLIFKVT